MGFFRRSVFVARTDLTVRGFVLSVTVERRRASGGKQKSLRAQSCMAGSASADRGSLGVYSVSTQRLGGGKLLVGKAGRAVCHMDDTAAGKAVLFQQMLHDLVVGVGVGT